MDGIQYQRFRDLFYQVLNHIKELKDDVKVLTEKLDNLEGKLV